MGARNRPMADHEDLRRELERERLKVLAQILVIQAALWGFFLTLNRQPGFPFDPPGGIAFIAALAWTIVLLVITARRTRGFTWILGAALANAFLETVVIFAGFYWHFGTRGNFNVTLSHIDALYFTLGTLTTAGTGSIVPDSQLIRSLASVQMILDLLLVTGAAALAISRLAERD